MNNFEKIPTQCQFTFEFKFEFEFTLEFAHLQICNTTNGNAYETKGVNKCLTYSYVCMSTSIC